MANGALYAWSPIKVGEPASRDRDGTTQPGATRVIKPGETVTQSDTGLNDEQWAQLLDSGAVRTLEYPSIPDTYQDSPVQYLREQAKISAGEALANAENSEVNLNAIRAANAASTGTEILSANLEPGTPTSEPSGVEFQRNNDGDLFASEDGGKTWRPATDAEKAAQG